MKYYYLIIGMDLLNGYIFYPGPCLFETEEESDKYIKLNSDKFTKFCRKRVEVGKINIDNPPDI